MNKQNFSYWGTVNPNNDLIKGTTRSVLKVTVWEVIGGFEVIGPYFTEDINSNTVAGNQVDHQKMIETFYLPQL